MPSILGKGAVSIEEAGMGGAGLVLVLIFGSMCLDHKSYFGRGVADSLSEKPKSLFRVRQA